MNRKIKDVEIRQATAEDMRQFYPDGSPRTTYSWIAYYKGEPACIAGLIVERSGCVVYSEVKEGINAPKITIWRTACAMFELIKQLGFPMYAACERADHRAMMFVNKLGFIYRRELQGLGLFIWQK